MLTPNQRYHDRVASRYDDIYAKDPYWSYYRDVSWQDLKRSLPTDLALPVLDVGCGTGLYGLKLMRSGFRVVFSDLSRKMLDVADRNARTQFPGRRVEAVQADITDLEPFDDRQFSLVVAQGDVLSFALDWQRALSSVRRVLAPGGRAVLSVDSRFGGVDPFLKQNDLDGLEDFLRCGTGEWLADRPEERFPFHAFVPDELARCAGRAGLVLVRIIGKTLFDLRHGHCWLDDTASRRRLLALELRYGETAFALGRAHHLQVTFALREDVGGGEDALREKKAARRGRGRKKGAG
jgi:SAM-dependent methyltransferase